MKRSLPKILTALAVVWCVLATALIIIEFLGYRFTSKNAAGYIWESAGNGEREHIDAGNWDFYYYTFPITDGEKQTDEYIANFLSVKKYGFLYKAADIQPAYYVCTADVDGYCVGRLYRYEGEQGDNYFFLFNANPSSKLFIENWSKALTVKLDGAEVELFKHAYFTAEKEFSSIAFGKCELRLSPYIDE